MVLLIVLRKYINGIFPHYIPSLNLYIIWCCAEYVKKKQTEKFRDAYCPVSVVRGIERNLSLVKTYID